MENKTIKSSEDLVSIIMPSYNCEKWIRETIRSVQNQTYKNWELIITDDASTDNTVKIIQEEQKLDNRIKLYVSDNNQGAGESRNNSLQHSSGRYVAYLDADDLWVDCKLEHQIKYMRENNILMCYTNYDIINENGDYRKTINVPLTVTYEGYLKRPITCTHSIIFDLEGVRKELLIMPNVRRGQDGATWLQVLKTGIIGKALNESLAKYRRHSGSLSNNKVKAIKRMWYLYREIEHLSFFYACRCFVSYAFNAIKKYS